MKLIKKIFICWILGLHDWTCKASEGIQPEGIKTELDFWEYAKMYCKCCGKVSPLSQKEIDKVKNKYEKCPTCDGKGVLPEGYFFTKVGNEYRGNKEGDKCNICLGAGVIVAFDWEVENI